MSFDDSRHRARRVAIVAAGVLLTAMIALPAIWAQEQERPPSDLSSLTVAGSVSVINFGPINVVGCAKKQDDLVCNFVLKNDSTSTVDVKYGGSVWTTKRSSVVISSMGWASAKIWSHSGKVIGFGLCRSLLVRPMKSRALGLYF
jgi:hypothetical protein